MSKFSVSVSQIPRLIGAFYGSGRTVYLRGQPGCGKTDLVHEGARQITAAYHQMEVCDPDIAVYELHLASMSEVDIRGYLIPSADGEARFTKPVFAAAVERSKRGILFLDEFAQANHEVQKAVAPLLLNGTIGEYKLPAGWMVVAAGNREDDNAGVNNMLSHIINRISIIDVDPPEVDDWVDWAVKAGLSLEAITFAKMQPGTLMGKPDLSANDKPYCTPRSLHALDDVARRWPSPDGNPDNGGLAAMCNDKAGFATMVGFIGEGAAAELRAVLTITSKLPRYEDIIADPGKIKLPKEPNEQYASTMMVALRAKIEDGAAVVEYLTRYNPNMAAVGITALIVRDIKFSQVKLVGDWIRSNSDFVKRIGKYVRMR